jgi:hypothetical protein
MTATVATPPVIQALPGSPLTRAVHDTLAVADRNLIVYRRAPQLLVFSTIQPVVFALMFRSVFGGLASRSRSSPICSPQERCSGRAQAAARCRGAVPQFLGQRRSASTGRYRGSTWCDVRSAAISVSLASITRRNLAWAPRSAANSSGPGWTSGTNHTRSSPTERDQI